MKRILLACVLAAEFSAANAQLYSFPAPPMTVADCRPGQVWMQRSNGLPYCDTPVPPPPPCCVPPPPPACQYELYRFGIHIGDMGQCSADGGCEGKGYMIYFGGSVVASEMWIGYMEWPEVNARASSGIAASGYRIGASKGTYLGNGNMMGLANYEVCR
ncbi:hypothetical protein [Cupriavidus necator]